MKNVVLVVKGVGQGPGATKEVNLDLIFKESDTFWTSVKDKSVQLTIVIGLSVVGGFLLMLYASWGADYREKQEAMKPSPATYKNPLPEESIMNLSVEENLVIEGEDLKSSFHLPYQPPTSIRNSANIRSLHAIS
jgi:hypothetical protein